MRSIWNNNFYYTQPALSWVYRLDMSCYTGRGENDPLTKKDGDILSEAIIGVSLGKRESEFVPVYFGGVESKVFTRAKTSDSFTIKFSEDKNFTITSIFENLYNYENMNQYYPESNAGDKVYNSYSVNRDDYTDINSRIIAIKIFDPNSLPTNEYRADDGLIATLKFYGCKLASLNDMEFSYESTESITRDVTFFYNYMKFIRAEHDDEAKNA